VVYRLSSATALVLAIMVVTVLFADHAAATHLDPHSGVFDRETMFCSPALAGGARGIAVICTADRIVRWTSVILLVLAAALFFLFMNDWACDSVMLPISIRLPDGSIELQRVGDTKHTV